MFEIAKNTNGVEHIITNNAKIAEGIREENAQIKVWFTGAPTVKVALGIADGLAQDFGRETVIRSGEYGKFYVAFKNSK